MNPNPLQNLLQRARAFNYALVLDGPLFTPLCSVILRGCGRSATATLLRVDRGEFHGAQGSWIQYFD